jgi:hypothetical protein
MSTGSKKYCPLIYNVWSSKQIWSSERFFRKRVKRAEMVKLQTKRAIPKLSPILIKLHIFSIYMKPSPEKKVGGIG